MHTIRLQGINPLMKCSYLLLIKHDADNPCKCIVQKELALRAIDVRERGVQHFDCILPSNGRLESQILLDDMEQLQLFLIHLCNAPKSTDPSAINTQIRADHGYNKVGSRTVGRAFLRFLASFLVVVGRFPLHSAQVHFLLVRRLATARRNGLSRSRGVLPSVTDSGNTERTLLALSLRGDRRCACPNKKPAPGSRAPPLSRCAAAAGAIRPSAAVPPAVVRSVVNARTARISRAQRFFGGKEWRPELLSAPNEGPRVFVTCLRPSVRKIF